MDLLNDAVGMLQQQFGIELDATAMPAAQSLTAQLPQLMDQASSGGSLLDEFAGSSSGGLLDAAKSFLK